MIASRLFPFAAAVVANRRAASARHVRLEARVLGGTLDAPSDGPIGHPLAAHVAATIHAAE